MKYYRVIITRTLDVYAGDRAEAVQMARASEAHAIPNVMVVDNPPIMDETVPLRNAKE